jgi:hypothetical protein
MTLLLVAPKSLRHSLARQRETPDFLRQWRRLKVLVFLLVWINFVSQNKPFQGISLIIYDPQSGTYLGYDGLRHPCP